MPITAITRSLSSQETTKASGEKLVIRPSGTEPKIKYYIFLVEGKDGRSALEEKKGDILNEFKSAL